MKHVPDELRTLDKLLADKYFCNFSLFQSLPDSLGHRPALPHHARSSASTSVLPCQVYHYRTSPATATARYRPTS